MYSTKAKGPRYLEMAEGYVTQLALDENGEIIGYEYVNLGIMMDNISKGVSGNEALEKAKKHYGRFENAHSYINPRKQ